MVKIIFIEGNIGAGKSTLCMLLKNIINCQVIFEPVDIWKNTVDASGKSILERFYEDPKAYAYSFQTYLLLTQLEQIKSIDYKKEYVFIERSIMSNKCVFAKTNYEGKFITDMEWVLYNKWFDHIKSCMEFLPEQHYIYLRSDPEVCLKRIMKRKRKGEAEITLEYLKLIHEKHEKWLSGALTLDGNSSFISSGVTLKAISNAIKKHFDDL